MKFLWIYTQTYDPNFMMFSFIRNENKGGYLGGKSKITHHGYPTFGDSFGLRTAFPMRSSTICFFGSDGMSTSTLAKKNQLLWTIY
jgi:hypothetical protein